MSATPSPTTGRRYSVSRVCRIFELARSTYYAWRARARNPEPGKDRKHRPGPVPFVSDSELASKIAEVFEGSPFVGEGYRKAHARLKALGIPASKERVRRVMGEYGLLAPSHEGNAHGPRAHDGTIVTDRPDEMWGTDATSTWLTTGRTANIFVVVDHCTSECLSLHASLCGDREEAIDSLHQAVREVFGPLAPGQAAGLRIRHDRGPQFISDDYQSELEFLGIESSPAFVREPEGNGCSERFIRTLKEQLLWLRSFDSIDELRDALEQFRRTYNQHWLVQKHGHLTPAQVRASFVENSLPRAA